MARRNPEDESFEESGIEVLTDFTGSNDYVWVVYRDEPGGDSIMLEYWDDPASYGEEGGQYTVYQVAIEPDVTADLDWVKWDDVAQYSGISRKELEEAGRSKDVTARAQVYEAAAGYNGWGELDPSPLSMSQAEMILRWPSYVEIPMDALSAVEEAADEMANENFVQGHSTLDDQMMIDLNEMGYADATVAVIATAGDAIGVNGDVVEESPESELEAEGFEYISKLSGAWPGGEEAELDREWVVRRAHRESGIAEDVLELAVDHELGTGSELYRGSSDGDIETYAKPKADGE